MFNGLWTRQRSWAQRSFNSDVLAALELIPLGLTHNLSVVMPGLVPGTHVLLPLSSKRGVGGRDKPGHDALGVST
jgi:hypothetical protein